MSNGSIKSIRTGEDCDNALSRIDKLMDSEPGSAGFEELRVLADLVEHYESKREPMGWPA